MYGSEEEKQAREEILKLVAEYAKAHHTVKNAFQPGDRIPYAARVYDEAEMVNLVDSALEFWLTAGRYTQAFEKELAEFLHTGHCILVNSGSSANLLALMALTSPLLGERQIKPGDEVITVAAAFPTTVSPVLQYGATPVFVDIAMPGCNIDTALLETALSARTKAVMLAHTLGNPFDLCRVRDFCRAHGLWLIEDNCDALGSRYKIDGEWRYTGTVGDIGTSSFYPPHHMTMGEGGAVYTDDPLLAKIMYSMRDWGRDCTCPPGRDNLCGRRFDGQHGLLPSGYDHKYVYSHFGYNLKCTDMQAAVGLAQLRKLPEFIQARKRNRARLYDRLSDPALKLKDVLEFQEPDKNSDPSWFGFLITVKKTHSRQNIIEYLERHLIQTRMLFAGNLIKHPCFDGLREFDGLRKEAGGRYKIVAATGEGDLPVTDHVMAHAFWVGVYPGLTDEMIDYVAEKIAEAVKIR